MPNPIALRERFAIDAPSDQLAVDIFEGEWNCKLPGDIATGSIDLFHDHRIVWAHKIFNFSDEKILELGPLEAAYTYMADEFGARSVFSVEDRQGTLFSRQSPEHASRDCRRHLAQGHGWRRGEGASPGGSAGQGHDVILNNTGPRHPSDCAACSRVRHDGKRPRRHHRWGAPLHLD